MPAIIKNTIGKRGASSPLEGNATKTSRSDFLLKEEKENNARLRKANADLTDRVTRLEKQLQQVLSAQNGAKKGGGNDGWRSVSRAGARHVETPAVLLHNRFEALQPRVEKPIEEIVEMEEGQISEGVPETAPPPKERVAREKVPPFFIKNMVGQTTKGMHNVLKASFKSGEYTLANVGGSRIMLKMSTVAGYVKARALLDERKYQYYTHTLESERLVKVVLTGLTTEYSEEEVLEALNEELGEVKPTKVVRLQTPFTRKLDTKRAAAVTNGLREDNPIPVKFVVSFPPGTTSADVELTGLMGIRTRFEQLRMPNTPLQCFNCLGFNHATALCRLQARCVKCAGHHSSKVCNVVTAETPREQLKCIHCDGPHPASYMGCPRMPKIAAKKPNVQQQRQDEGRFGPRQNVWEQRRMQQQHRRQDEGGIGPQLNATDERRQHTGCGAAISALDKRITSMQEMMVQILSKLGVDNV